jgi:hypothetical protein
MAVYVVHLLFAWRLVRAMVGQIISETTPDRESWKKKQ